MSMGWRGKGVCEGEGWRVGEVLVVSFALSQALKHFKEGGMFPFTSVVSLIICKRACSF